MRTTLRGSAFRVVDHLRGAPVGKELADITLLMATGRADRSSRLEALLTHARAQVPFYGDVQSKRLVDYPVMNKLRILDLADNVLARGYAEQTVYTASTSGSTGTPFRIRRDSRKQRRVQAETIFWGRLAGYELGQTLVYMKVWSGRNRLGPMSSLARNVIAVDVTRMNQSGYWELYESLVRRRSPVSVIGYSSALESLLRAVESRRRLDELSAPPQMAGVVAQSEALAPEVRAAFAGLFGRVPYTRYGLEELGIVGQQVPGSGERYLVNGASHVVEILDPDRDEPVKAGAVGRIVVTDLFNYAQPMIRYDTGDLGSFAVGPDGEAVCDWLETVAGRRLDQVYDTRDQPLSPLCMYKIWWRYPEINQYQLVQRGKGDYLVRLNVGDAFAREEELIDDLRDLVGQGARCAVERTDDPLVLASGKRKSVVSLYRP